MPVLESDLLQKINTAFASIDWPRYKRLIALRDEETLTDDEYAELLTLSDAVEGANVKWLEALIELAKLRNVSLRTVMRQLKIRKRAYS